MISRRSSGPARLLVCAAAFFLTLGNLSAEQTGQETTGDESSAENQIPEKDWLFENTKIAEAVDGIEKIVVVNHEGTVRLRDGAKNLDGQILSQRAKADPRRARMQLQREGSTLSLKIHWQIEGEGSTEPTGEESELWQKRHVDLALAIPPGLDVDVETVDQAIETKGLTGALSARSEKGQIIIRGSHAATVESRSGKIRMICRKAERSGPIHLSSVNGNIRLDLMAGSAGRATLATRGAITSDFSIEIDHAKRGPGKKGVVDLGGEGPEIRLENTNGPIRLGRLPASE